MAEDFKVKDISQADFGRKEISLAETEMPGLIACRELFSKDKPLKGSNKLTNPNAQSINVIICGSLIMTFYKQLKKLFQS